jgi:hyaluronoglucosaminidase
MAVSPDSRTLFIGTGNNEVVAVDIATGRRESLIPLPTPGSGVVSPAALAVTPDGRTLYVAEYDDDTVIPVNLATGRPGAPIIIEAAVLGLESALAITPDGRTLYAAVNGDYGGGSGPNSLVAISTATGTVEQTVNFGTAGPIALAVTPDGRTLYALNGNYSDGIVPGTSTITPVSTADDRLGGAVRTGGLFSHASAFGFAVAPDGRTVYVAQGDVVAVALPR